MKIFSLALSVLVMTAALQTNGFGQTTTGTGGNNGTGGGSTNGTTSGPGSAGGVNPGFGVDSIKNKDDAPANVLRPADKPIFMRIDNTRINVNKSKIDQSASSADKSPPAKNAAVWSCSATCGDAPGANVKMTKPTSTSMVNGYTFTIGKEKQVPGGSYTGRVVPANESTCNVGGASDAPAAVLAFTDNMNSPTASSCCKKVDVKKVLCYSSKNPSIGYSFSYIATNIGVDGHGSGGSGSDGGTGAGPAPSGK